MYIYTNDLLTFLCDAIVEAADQSKSFLTLLIPLRQTFPLVFARALIHEQLAMDI